MPHVPGDPQVCGVGGGLRAERPAAPVRGAVLREVRTEPGGELAVAQAQAGHRGRSL